MYIDFECRRKQQPTLLNRSAFAMVMDMWHDDLDIFMRKPGFVEQSTDGDVEETVSAPVIVN